MMVLKNINVKIRLIYISDFNTQSKVNENFLWAGLKYFDRKKSIQIVSYRVISGSHFVKGSEIACKSRLMFGSGN
jgi:hypothetical protein